MYHGMIVAGIPGADGEFRRHPDNFIRVGVRPKFDYRDLVEPPEAVPMEEAFTTHILRHREIFRTVEGRNRKATHVWTNPDWDTDRILGQLLAGYVLMNQIRDVVDQEGFYEKDEFPSLTTAEDVLLHCR